jgi:hypothetical protein
MYMRQDRSKTMHRRDIILLDGISEPPDGTSEPSRAEVDAIAAAASSLRPEGVVLQAAPRSGLAEDACSDEGLLSARGATPASVSLRPSIKLAF